MSFYPVMPPDVPPAGGEDATPGRLARAGMVAVRAADLASPCGRGLGFPPGATPADPWNRPPSRSDSPAPRHARHPA